MSNVITTIQHPLHPKTGIDHQYAARIAREAVGWQGDCAPIKIIAGDSAPRKAGQSYYWTTPSGKTIVRHPQAYGWRTVYHGSSRRIEVGIDWLVARGA